MFIFLSVIILTSLLQEFFKTDHMSGGQDIDQEI